MVTFERLATPAIALALIPGPSTEAWPFGVVLAIVVVQPLPE